MTRSSNYPQHCCATGCETVAENRRELTDRMFRFVLKRQSGGRKSSNKSKQMYEKRFYLWLDALQQQPDGAESLWVCHRHFVRGRPAGHGNRWDIDWIPTQNLKPKWIEKDENQSPVPEVAEQIQRLSFSEDVLEKPPFEEQPDVESPFCRLCLQRNMRMRPLFPTPRNEENYLLQLTKLMAGIELEFEVDYNSFLCRECENKLEEFYSFRELWQSNDVLLRSLRNQTRRTNPVPVVSIPIDRLLEDPEDGTEPPPVTACPTTEEPTDELPPEVKTEELVIEASRLNEPEEPTVPTTTEKYPAAELPTVTQPSRSNETIPPKPKHDEVSPAAEEIIDVDAIETEREEMIRKVMKKVRRETLTPRKRKLSGGSPISETKKRKLKRSLSQSVLNNSEKDKG